MSTDGGAPSGENTNFSKNGQTHILPLGAPESLEMLLNMVFHIYVPISLQKYVVFTITMFSPLGVPPSLEILPVFARVRPMLFPVLYSYRGLRCGTILRGGQSHTKHWPAKRVRSIIRLMSYWNIFLCPGKDCSCSCVADWHENFDLRYSFEQCGLEVHLDYFISKYTATSSLTSKSLRQVALN